jgi:hypothetical protein
LLCALGRTVPGDVGISSGGRALTLYSEMTQGASLLPGIDGETSTRVNLHTPPPPRKSSVRSQVVPLQMRIFVLKSLVPLTFKVLIHWDFYIL